MLGAGGGWWEGTSFAFLLSRRAAAGRLNGERPEQKKETFNNVGTEKRFPFFSKDNSSNNNNNNNNLFVFTDKESQLTGEGWRVGGGRWEGGRGRG